MSMDYLFADEIKATGKSTKGSEKSICDERGIRCEFPEISGFGHTIAGIVMLTVVLCGTCSIQYFHIRFEGKLCTSFLYIKCKGHRNYKAYRRTISEF